MRPLRGASSGRRVDVRGMRSVTTRVAAFDTRVGASPRAGCSPTWVVERHRVDGRRLTGPARLRQIHIDRRRPVGLGERNRSTVRRDAAGRSRPSSRSTPRSGRPALLSPAALPATACPRRHAAPEGRSGVGHGRPRASGGQRGYAAPTRGWRHTERHRGPSSSWSDGSTTSRRVVAVGSRHWSAGDTAVPRHTGATIWFSLRRSPTTCWSVISLGDARRVATLGAVSVRSSPAPR